MAQNSRINILESQIRVCFGRVVWSHKTQEKCSDILNKRNSIIKYSQIVLSALTTTGILVTIFGDIKIIGIISSILSAISFGINMYIKSYDLGSIAQKHAESAVNLWNIREKYFSLITDIKSQNIKEKEILTIRDKLQEELFNAYKGSPRSISKAYKEATIALKMNEELTFSDEEIDSFLPIELKKLK